jgi:hypothetical protein
MRRRVRHLFAAGLGAAAAACASSPQTPRPGTEIAAASSDCADFKRALARAESTLNAVSAGRLTVYSAQLAALNTRLEQAMADTALQARLTRLMADTALQERLNQLNRELSSTEVTVQVARLDSLFVCVNEGRG